MVDYINQLRIRGMEKDAAIIEGSELFAQLGVTLFGGMISSTFLPLLVLPVIYSLIDTLRDSTRRLFESI